MQRVSGEVAAELEDLIACLRPEGSLVFLSSLSLLLFLPLLLFFFFVKKTL